MSKRIAYADPPYPGCAHLYPEREEVDHAALLAQLESGFDGWVLHTNEPGLRVVVPLMPKGARVMAWVKPFCAFKRNVPVAYAWEPVIVKACRKPVVSGREVPMRDWKADLFGNPDAEEQTALSFDAGLRCLVVVAHPDYGSGSFEILVVPPDWCPAPSGC